MEHNIPLLRRLDSENLRDYQAVPFWSWNDRLKPEHLRQQIRDMDEAGMGGFFMHARGGLETPYMEEEWFAAVEASVDEAKKLGMNAWCYDENGWPSGFAGGALLENPDYWVHYLRYALHGHFDTEATVVYALENNRLRRLSGPEAGVTEYHCVYDCTNSSFTDILNPDVVDAFIAHTYQTYYDRFSEEFGKTIAGFFTDEPQYFRGQTAYSPMILKEFPKLYGTDPLDMLGSLFVDCEGCTGFRFRYWRLMNVLLCENFGGRIYRWCEEHNCQFTGHTIEESSLSSQMEGCAGVMPFYEYEHIPGIDWLCRDIQDRARMAPRQLASAAQQLGKKHTITETFGCAGWDVTPRELKRIAEIQYVSGVNMMCHHLYPYSIRGQRKRDYPAFYTSHNPWTRELAAFNAHFTNLGYLLAETREEAPVLVIHPMHNTYLTFDRRDSWNSTKDLEGRFQQLLIQLCSAGIGHHYGDERLMEKYGRVEGATLAIGKCSYECVLIPDMSCLDNSTVALLREYTANGGKLYLAGQTPSLMDGDPADLSFLKPNTDWEQLVQAYGHFTRQDSLVEATLRRSDEGEFLFAVNLSMEHGETIGFRLPFGGAVRFDPMTKALSGVPFRAAEGGIIVEMTLAPGESVVLFRDDAAVSAASTPAPTRILPLEPVMAFAAPVENALTLDTAQLSYDGITYTEALPVTGLSDLLLRRRENRDIYLRYNFCADFVPEDLMLEVETVEGVSLFVNGKAAALPETGTVDPSFRRGNIAPLVRTGNNEIVMKLHYHQSELVYHVFNAFYYGNGEVTETLINCLSYETNIESVYLFGGFCVRAEHDYRPDIMESYVVAPGFTLTQPTDRVDVRSITAGGFPFLRGSVTLNTQVELTDTDYTLRCHGRVQYVKVWVNGEFAGTMLFQETLDLSGLLRPGTNDLRLELMASNRNLLGPAHMADRAETTGVGPDEFSRFGTWDNCQSNYYTPNYSFVRFGLDICQLEK